MKSFIPLLLTVTAADAAMNLKKGGVEYTIVRTDNGKEVPVKLGPDLGISSRGPVRVNAPVTRRNNVQNTGNWCGMSNTVPPPGASWVNVYGTWVVPTVSLRAGQSASQTPSVAQWVGIDGDDSCATGLIQGGTVSQINSSGAQENYAWWEFVPDALTPIQMTVNVGDTMIGNVTVTSPTSGIVEIINASNGQGLAVTVNNGPGSLCGDSAEWIMEDLSGGGGFLPFAEFPSGSFAQASSHSSNGEWINAAGADFIDLYQNNVQMCAGSYDSGNDLVNYASTA